MSEAEESTIGPTKVEIAFEEYRRGYGPPRYPRGTKIGDLTLQITAEDGLLTLADGEDLTNADGGSTHLAPGWQSTARHLWVIRMEDVVHTLEDSEFGSRRIARAVKHTNITGGARAYAGGEVVFVGPSQIVISGWSGRYPVRSRDAMLAVELAFKQSGYDVWSTGWDPDGRKAVPVGTIMPSRVA